MRERKFKTGDHVVAEDDFRPMPKYYHVVGYSESGNLCIEYSGCVETMRVNDKSYRLVPPKKKVSGWYNVYESGDAHDCDRIFPSRRLADTYSDILHTRHPWLKRVACVYVSGEEGVGP